MERREIQRLAAANVTAELYEELAAHGEDLLVERKAQIPEPERLGAEVASMANMLGGWVLLGVDDETHALEALQLPKGIDIQSHVGNLLRKSVDPVPPFLADVLKVNDTTVGFVRVFPASVPILVTGSGAVYTRDDGGKRPVSDHLALLDLARRGREAEEGARQRPDNNALTVDALGLDRFDNQLNSHMRVTVRAAPLTVGSQVAEWPISSGPQTCVAIAQELASKMGARMPGREALRPFGRAAIAAVVPQRDGGSCDSDGYEVVAAADCVGVFGVLVVWPVVNVVEVADLREKYIRPAIEAVAKMLHEAEALGDAVFDLHLLPRREVSLMSVDGHHQHHKLAEVTHCGSAVLSIPADATDCADLAARWEREVARSTGISAWEPTP
jgi:schlafen family protein